MLGLHVIDLQETFTCTCTYNYVFICKCILLLESPFLTKLQPTCVWYALGVFFQKWNFNEENK